jgi:hypothetical protein
MIHPGIESIVLKFLSSCNLGNFPSVNQCCQLSVLITTATQTKYQIHTLLSCGLSSVEVKVETEAPTMPADSGHQELERYRLYKAPRLRAVVIDNVRLRLKST